MKRTILFSLILALFAFSPSFAGSVQFMEKEELKSLLGSENLVILDVRTGRDWSTSEFKIPGAVRASSGDFSNWSSNYAKDSTIVLYCA